MESFLTLADVDMEKTLALRTAAGEESMGFLSVLVLESALTRDASDLRIIENATLDVTTGDLVIMWNNV